MYKALDLWLPSYLTRRRFRRPEGTVDLLVCLCDHFEPFHRADKATALRRVGRWQVEYPKLIAPFIDADGCRPRHTFFYPIEQYDADVASQLAELCASCGAEVEIQLHHENDTAETLRGKLQRGKEAFLRYDFLARDGSGEVRYGFVHGNWALGNSHPLGKYCGVDSELEVLRQTGCYADFTMPSAPDPTQTRTINSIYYAKAMQRPKAHDVGTAARVGTPGRAREGELLLVQGPLGLNWRRRKLGLWPSIENGDLTGINVPRPDRLRVWLNLGIQVEGQPNWIFIKLHTHGAIEKNMAALLGDPMRRFFEHLISEYNDGTNYRVHFVTARELVNIVHAAEDGKTGHPGACRDYHYKRRAPA